MGYTHRYFSTWIWLKWLHGPWSVGNFTAAKNASMNYPNQAVSRLIWIFLTKNHQLTHLSWAITHWIGWYTQWRHIVSVWWRKIAYLGCFVSDFQKWQFLEKKKYIFSIFEDSSRGIHGEFWYAVQEGVIKLFCNFQLYNIFFPFLP